MVDREKVIRGLEACNRQSYNGSDCQNCPYYDDEDTVELPFGICNIQDMFDDALALLREQQPRVMTLEEVEKMAAKSDPDPICAEWSTGQTGWIVGSIRLLADMMKNGNRNIRAWTSRPTPEQMRETKWEEDGDAE